jgi:hypothetical protein
VSLDDCPKLTWSFGWTGVLLPSWPPGQLDAARVDGRYDPGDAEQSEFFINPDFCEPCGERPGRCHAGPGGLRVHVAVGAYLVQLMARQDVVVCLTSRGVAEEVDAAVCDGDVAGLPSPQRRPVIVRDDAGEGLQQVAGGIVDRAAQRRGQP